jgi:hypothetical protein
VKSTRAGDGRRMRSWPRDVRLRSSSQRTRHADGTARRQRAPIEIAGGLRPRMICAQCIALDRLLASASEIAAG